MQEPRNIGVEPLGQPSIEREGSILRRLRRVAWLGVAKERRFTCDACYDATLA